MRTSDQEKINEIERGELPETIEIIQDLSDIQQLAFKLLMANDMSARPHEIFNLRINDIQFKTTEEGTQNAEVLITGGKTKPRILPLIESLPHVKDWISSHPTGGKQLLVQYFVTTPLQE